MFTRKTISILLAAASLAIAAPAAAHADPLVGQWHLDDTAALPGTASVFYVTPDSSGNSQHLSAGLPLQLANLGRFGKAVSGFNVNNVLMTTTASPKLQQQRLTVMAWIRHAGYPGGLQYIVGEGDNGATCSAASWALYTGPYSDPGLRFYMLPTGSSSAIFSPAASSSVWDGQWHQVTATYDGAAVRLFIDGKQAGSGTPAPDATINYGLSGKSFYVDGYPNVGCGSGDFFGDIDEVRVYGRSLSGSEIQRISDFGGINPAPLVPDPPIIHTTDADKLTPASARINGTIDDRGDALSYRVEYGRTTAYGRSTGVAATAGSTTGEQPVSLAIGGLEPATDYHARLVSAAADRAAAGEDVTFRTAGVPRLRFAEPNVSVPEAGGSAKLTVELAGSATQPVTVHYATSEGTAAADSDYAETSGDLTFAAGEQSQTIEIPVMDDGKDESDESVFVTLSGPSANAELGSTRQVQLRIADDDEAPKTTINATPERGGAEQATAEVVAVGRTSTGEAVETRCVVNPAAAPKSFDDLQARCPLLGASSTFTTPGEYNIYAASRDAAGNTEPVVTRTVFVTDSPDTTVTEGPSGYLGNPIARYTFTSSIPNSTFECRIDDSAFTPCFTPYTTNPLPVGGHRFEVRAIGPNGGVDATPAHREFRVTIAETSITRDECSVNPVRHWLFGEINAAGNGFIGSGEGMWACHIGPPRVGGCPAESNCAVHIQRCPRGARCTITTRAVWQDADVGPTWGVRAIASMGAPATPDSYWVGYSVKDRVPKADAACYTDDAKGTGSRCTATARLVVLGNGSAIWGTCNWEPYYASGSALGGRGTSDQRRIDCSTTVRMDPATPLDAIVNDSNVVASAPSAGDVVATWSVKPAAKVKASAVAVSAAKPAIAATRVAATDEGPVELKPVLNAAARRLLKSSGRLAVKLHVVFTPAGGGAAVTRDQDLVLRQVARQPRTCMPRLPKPGQKKLPRMKRCR